MALLPEEILFAKYSLGVSQTSLGAEPYITYLAVFDRAIQPYIIDPTTTTTTAVVAAVGGAVIALTVAAIPLVLYTQTPTPAFVQGSTVLVDVGPGQESTQVLAVSGLTVWVTLANAHGGPTGAYPITMAGGEKVVRDILNRLHTFETLLGTIAPRTAGVSKVDEIELYASVGGGGRGAQTKDTHDSLVQQRDQARTDLGDALGFPDLRKVAQRAGSRVELY